VIKAAAESITQREPSTTLSRLAVKGQSERSAPPVSDPERLRQAVIEHYELVWRALRRLGVAPGSVEDAAQQVLLVLSRRLAEVRPGAERAFLLATATRVAADYRKMHRRRREDLDETSLAARASEAPLPDEQLDRDRARRLLDVVLDELPDELRTVFVFFELEGMKTNAIAELLSLPAGTVASRLRRARETFEIAAARLAPPRKQP
jgi:RNA polymerase sigma-70 factor, ECF subfamily